jgi:dipeptidase E
MVALRIMRLLLISNSTSYGSGYLDHCAEAIKTFLRPSGARVLFVPYAAHDLDAYADKARGRFETMGIPLDSIHRARPRVVSAVERADAIFIGGGNTFRLLDTLQRENLIEPIRRRIGSGAPYLGASAGSNVACPTIKTTNDMPIVEPASFEALNLVPFQINPHYLDPFPGSTHMGETREQRIAEFHEENDAAVVGLREGTWLQVEGQILNLQGAAGARIFIKGQTPSEHPAGSRLDFLISSSSSSNLPPP